jgi:hypothetical protein
MAVPKSNWIARYRQAAGRLITLMDDLKELHAEYDSRVMSSTLVQDDFDGESACLTPAEINDAIYLSNVITTAWGPQAAGFYKIRG